MPNTFLGLPDADQLAAEYIERIKKKRALPRNADRYTVLNIFPDEVPAKIAAAKSLGLEWFAQDSYMNYVKFYVFFDKAGLQNYRDGLYTEKEDGDEQE